MRPYLAALCILLFGISLGLSVTTTGKQWLSTLTDRQADLVSVTIITLLLVGVVAALPERKP